MQGILNSIEGCLIRGENYNFIYDIFNSYKCILRSKKIVKQPYPNNSWYGAYLLNEEIFIENIKVLLKKLLIADKDESNIIAYGFKEIRYAKIPDLFDYLDFLKLVFPNVAFIFNTRRLEDVVKSGWWVNHNTEKTKSILSDLEEKFRIYNSRTQNCFSIDYNEVIQKSENLLGLYDFLGAEYNSEKIDQVLKTLHGYSPTQARLKMFGRRINKSDAN